MYIFMCIVGMLLLFLGALYHFDMEEYDDENDKLSLGFESFYRVGDAHYTCSKTGL